MKIIVIGAGPAGLLAALEASRHGSVLLLEKGPAPGRKLLVTGSGQCNLTHDSPPAEMLSHYSDKGKFLGKSISLFPPERVIQFFGNHGVQCMTEEHGKVFPSSRNARDILSVLVDQCRNAGVAIRTSCRITAVTKQEQGFTVSCDNSVTCNAHCVILAAGGKSYPETGSTGDGYAVAEMLGHNIIEPRPALSGVTIQHYHLGKLSGLSFRQAGITILREGKKVLTHRDDLLITRRGLSGPVVMDRSGRMEKGDIVEVDFTGRGEKFEHELLARQQENGSLQVSTLFSRMGLPKRFVFHMLDLDHADSTKKAAETGKKEMLRWAALFTRSRFVIASSGSFSSAMVTSGGIDTREINPSTMESRLVPGLFFAGEIIDIDGDSGGYNLQAAWSTGYLAGRSCLSCANLVL